MEVITGIYKITNIINNKCYIGQSKDIYLRWSRHRTASKNSNRKEYNYPLYQAMRKYGLENFTFEILERCSVQNLNKREIYWMEYYNPEYNQNPGGQNSNNFSKLTKEQVKEIKEILEKDIEGNITNKEIADKYNVYTETISHINSGHSWYEEGRHYPIRISKYDHIYQEKIKSYCVDCGKQITKGCLRCKNCDSIFRKNKFIENRPVSREELKFLIRTQTFVEIGKKYDVSDNTIRKWCDGYHLPRTKKEIKAYSDEEWKKI